MKKYCSVITTVAVLLSSAAVGVAALAQREGHGGYKPPAQYNRRQPEMWRQGGQMEMSMMTVNNLLAMSYLQNIAANARLLRDQVQQCGSVDGDFARDVTAEIWRSFDRLDHYRREQLDMNMMRRMETCLTRLSARLIELERETGAACPNPKWVLEHTNAILQIIDEMFTTRGVGHAASQNN